MPVFAEVLNFMLERDYVVYMISPGINAARLTEPWDSVIFVL